jgi:prepilin-type N-terminal cleavage/methylation domain-containing protein
MTHNQRGFSLAEVMIAMVILTVGVLGIAAASGYITKMSAEGGRNSGSAAVAESRIELITGTPCASIVSTGSATVGRYTETWSVTTSGLLRTITETVSYNMGRATRSSTYVAYMSCAPKAI